MSGDPGPLQASLHDALLWDLPQSTAAIKHKGPFTKLELCCILDIYTIIIDPSNQWVIQPSEELVARLISDHFVTRVVSIDASRRFIMIHKACLGKWAPNQSDYVPIKSRCLVQ